MESKKKLPRKQSGLKYLVWPRIILKLIIFLHESILNFFKWVVITINMEGFLKVGWLKSSHYFDWPCKCLVQCHTKWSIAMLIRICKKEKVVEIKYIGRNKWEGWYTVKGKIQMKIILIPSLSDFWIQKWRCRCKPVSSD